MSFLRHLLVPFLLLGHLFTMQPSNPHDRMVMKTEMSVVKINVQIGYQEGSCTGEVVGVNRVLTAAHCAGDAILGDGQPARIVAQDDHEDLLLLDVATARPALTVRTEPVVRFEELTAIGYAWGWERALVMEVKALLVDFTPDADEMAPGIFVQPGYIGGMSGGPVVDGQGLLVGIVQQSNEGIGYGVGGQAIADFLANLPQPTN